MFLKSIVIVTIYLVTIFAGSPLVQIICNRLNLPKDDKSGLRGAGKYIDILKDFWF